MGKVKNLMPIFVKDQKVLLTVFSFALLLFLLATFSVHPVYAGDGSGSPPVQGSCSIISDGDPPPNPPPSHKIVGDIHASNSPTGPVVGMSVYLYDIALYGDALAITSTDSQGHFTFEGSWIQPGHGYYISVNGRLRGLDPSLGAVCDYPLWSQHLLERWTDENAYSGPWPGIFLQHATPVIAPIGAMYSNTYYTTDMSYSSGSSHDVSFHASVGSAGFLTASSWTYGIGLGMQHVHCAQWGRYYFAVGYWDATSGGAGIASTGLSTLVDPGEWFRTIDVSEYLTPNLALPNYGLPADSSAFSFVIGGNEHADFYYSETGSFTWSYGFSGSVGINYMFFGASVNIDVTGTVTSGHTNTITLTVGPLPPAEQHHKFVVYTRGFSFTETNHQGGLELHIWDMGVIY